MTPKGTHSPPKHTFGCTERISNASLGELYERSRKQKVKSTRGYNFTHMPTRTPFAAATAFCRWCWTVGIIIHAKF